MKKYIIGFLLLSFISYAGLYDSLSTPEQTQTNILIKPKCPQPIIQKSFVSQKDLNQYKDKINAYKICMNTFIKKHTQNGNQKAVNNAISQWNEFIASQGEQKKSLGINVRKGLTSPGQSHIIGYDDQATITKDFAF